MNRGIPGLLENARSENASRLAVAYGTERLTFSELHEAAWAAAAGLAEFGVRAGDRVGICLRPSLGQPVAQLAASCAGAVIVPMHPNLMASSIAHVARDAGLTALITNESRATEFAAACPGVAVIPVGGEQVTTGGWRLGAPGESIPSARPSEETLAGLAMLIYSSGSTGRPKGIKVTHENVVRGAEIVSGYLGTTREDRIAGLLTLNFDYGLNQLWQSLLTGASLHMHDFVMPRTAFRMLAEERITALPVMPALVQRLFASRVGGPPADLDYSAMRYVCSSGGAVSDWAISRLEETFTEANIVLMYGLSEAFRSSFLPPEQLATRATSIGKAIPGVRLHVVDDNDDECATGEVGTLVHRGGCISAGYWNNPEATARVFRRLKRFPGETVVSTGDLATKDSEGYLYVLGRADSQLKRDGFRISPNDVEAVLNDHPAVAESVVLGLPDGDRGHRLVAAWSARPGFSAADEPERSWLVAQLASHMIPGELRHVASFPETANQGKVDRLALAKMFDPEPDQRADSRLLSAPRAHS